ncbi:hypothetical protein BAUCODRAFT_74016 [Baudoinia panamericana UAMH 10762]|uniref:Uncharacterized protein n=1 Tax=Baudoinia panamericana (strain UAMH 10762) TaxID=717646 RepID=M2N6S3_BAUPA|nr:uncharacterized protein BAUCODRAFT_74016 [Baudoinia panamericana UAMH 10762]EMC94779.1 hypothetical protein BAUCODRAFT_74016 [Baudoinia panamericana UAMH 10762]
MLPLNNTDYFTITPARHFSHFSDETPCCSPTFSSPEEQPVADPANPLLAYRESYLPTIPQPANVMQVQTSAAHGQTPSRPRPTPVQQNVLYVSDSDSGSDSNSSMGSGMMSPPELARCSRCQRTPSLDLNTRRSNMVQYGLNLWYCTRCAGMVGMTNR